MIELLAPAGNINKLKTAFHFGADAVYFAGKEFGLRAQAGNFSESEISEGISFAHSIGKKAYAAVNIFAFNKDFLKLRDYLQFLDKVNCDGIIVSDIGVLEFAKKTVPQMELHISTQANVTNKYSAKAYESAGAKRIVLARELKLSDIKEIRDYLDKKTELEAFVHGAMCISYSGRCLLSNFLTGRNGNRGECVQACRWEYNICEKSRNNNYLTLEEDNRGSYILNSKDLNMFMHLDELYESGVTSFKIEGRMKSEFYVATVVGAYRKAIDLMEKGLDYKRNEIYSELYKTSHRGFTTGMYLGENDNIETSSSLADCDYKFAAEVIKCEKGKILVEQRNRFKEGDILEIISPTLRAGEKIKVENLRDEKGESVLDAKLVQQRLYMDCEFKLQPLDILRIKYKGGDAANE